MKTRKVSLKKYGLEMGDYKKICWRRGLIFNRGLEIFPGVVSLKETMVKLQAVLLKISSCLITILPNISAIAIIQCQIQ